MAKSKKKTEGRKAELEKAARQAGRIAARAEKATRDAVERTKETSSMLIDFLIHPSHAAAALGKAVSAGQKQLSSSANEAVAVEKELRARLDSLIDERLTAVLHGLGLPTGTDLQVLVDRVNALEAAEAKPARKPAAKPAGAAKAAAKPAAKPAAKRAKAAPKPAARTAPKRAVKKPATPAK